MLLTTMHLTAVILLVFGDRFVAAIPTATIDALERRVDPDNVSMYTVDVCHSSIPSQRLQLARN